MPSLKYHPGLSLGVTLSGVILGVSCTSLFTGVTTSPPGGKQVMIEETPKTTPQKTRQSVSRVTNAETNAPPLIKSATNPPPSDTEAKPMSEVEGKPVKMVAALTMAELPEPAAKELTTPLPMPLPKPSAGPPSTPQNIPSVKELVNETSKVGSMPDKSVTHLPAKPQNENKKPKPADRTKDAPQKEPVTVSENNIVRIVESNNDDVIVTSFDAVVIIKGRCGKLTVAGGKNRIQCDRVREIEVIGNGNTLNLTTIEKGTVIGNSNQIFWKELNNGKEPNLISSGFDNKLLRSP
jgi:Protein of unknown function (DUF3060)